MIMAEQQVQAGHIEACLKNIDVKPVEKLQQD